MELEKAIENLKKYVELVLNKNYCDCNELNIISCGKYGDGSKNVAESIKTALKELEKLKKHIKQFYNGEIYTSKQLKQIEENQKKYFINKQIIKEKIKENNKLIEECKKDEEHYGEIYIYEHDNKILQELLEEK